MNYQICHRSKFVLAILIQLWLNQEVSKCHLVFEHQEFSPRPSNLTCPNCVNFRVTAIHVILLQMYEYRVSLQQANRIVVSVLFTNLTSYHLKDIEFNVLDSLNTKLMRGVCIVNTGTLCIINILGHLCHRHFINCNRNNR